MLLTIDTKANITRRNLGRAVQNTATVNCRKWPVRQGLSPIDQDLGRVDHRLGPVAWGSNEGLGPVCICFDQGLDPIGCWRMTFGMSRLWKSWMIWFLRVESVRAASGVFHSVRSRRNRRRSAARIDFMRKLRLGRGGVTGYLMRGLAGQGASIRDAGCNVTSYWAIWNRETGIIP